VGSQQRIIKAQSETELVFLGEQGAFRLDDPEAEAKGFSFGATIVPFAKACLPLRAHVIGVIERPVRTS